MDGGERRSSQYAAPYQPPAQTRPAPGEPMGPPAQDRYGQVLQSPARSDTGRSPVPRSYAPGYGNYGYQDQNFTNAQLPSASPMQHVDIQYATYGHESERLHQMAHPTQQHYPTYVQGSMLRPLQQQTLYEDMSQFQQQQQQQQRQTAAIAMATQFSVPTYMQPGEQNSVTVGSNPPQFLTSHSEQPSYSPVPVSRTRTPSIYTAPSSEYSLLDQVGLQEPQEEGNNQDALEEGLRQYQQQMKASFDAIRAGRVTEASEKLLGLSRWLLSSIVPLGLHHDDHSQYEQQLSMWREFNYCWDALGQKQKDITEEALRTRQDPSDLLDADTIKSIVGELVAMCDQIEQYGLVDYEMGVWEEEILSIFFVCLDLLPQDQATGRNPTR